MAGEATVVALLRGINVGGRSLVRMPELRELLSSLGFEQVQTYIQSGNVVFSTRAGDLGKLANRIESEIEQRFGLRPAVILRTPAELEAIVEANPYLADDAPIAKLHVMFLDRTPAAGAAAELDAGRSPPDEFTLLGREIYLHLPNGAGRSKLTIDYFERVLGVRGTQRNWNTVLKLLALTGR